MFARKYTYFFFNKFILETWAFQVIRAGLGFSLTGQTGCAGIWGLAAASGVGAFFAVCRAPCRCALGLG